MFDFGYVDYHGPLAISNMFLQLKPEENAIPVATSLLQLAIYGHKKMSRIQTNSGIYVKILLSTH